MDHRSSGCAEYKVYQSKSSENGNSRLKVGYLLTRTCRWRTDTYKSVSYRFYGLFIFFSRILQSGLVYDLFGIVIVIVGCCCWFSYLYFVVGPAHSAGYHWGCQTHWVHRSHRSMSSGQIRNHCCNCHKTGRRLAPLTCRCRNTLLSVKTKTKKKNEMKNWWKYLHRIMNINT